MQLPKDAGKSGLAALIRAGDDKDSFIAAQREIIADDGRVFFEEFSGQRQIEILAAADFFLRIGNFRITKFQANAFELFRILQIRDVKLDFAVESGNRLFEKISMLRAKAVQRAKRIGIQFGHPVQYFGFDMVQARKERGLDAVILHRTLFEFRKCFLNGGGVINFGIVRAHRDAAALDKHAVTDGRQTGLHFFGRLEKCFELVGFDISRQIIFKITQPA